MQLKAGEVEGVETPVGILPKREELLLEGLDEQTLADLDRILTIDTARWQQEIGHREKHLAQFDGLSDEIWEAHRRVAKGLEG
jgi:phosphoenolpyruvate carboxykinase (GTP)